MRSSGRSPEDSMKENYTVPGQKLDIVERKRGALRRRNLDEATYHRERGKTCEAVGQPGSYLVQFVMPSPAGRYGHLGSRAGVLRSQQLGVLPGSGLASRVRCPEPLVQPEGEVEGCCTAAQRVTRCG